MNECAIAAVDYWVRLYSGQQNRTGSSKAASRSRIRTGIWQADRLAAAVQRPIGRQGWCEPAARLQAPMARRVSDCAAAAQREPDLSVLRPCAGAQSPGPDPLRMHSMRLGSRCRCRRRNQYAKGAPRPLRLRSGRCDHAASRNPPTRLGGGRNASTKQ